MQAVILAGGLGTRLRPLTNNVPKPMVLVNGRPFLEYQIDLLKKKGIDDFVLCVGYKAERVQNHFGDGSRFGVRIRYSLEGEKLLGPPGALKQAALLLNDIFFVTYGDAYLMLDYRRVMSEFQKSSALGMMVVYENHGRFGKSDLLVREGRVAKYDKKDPTPDMVWINFGVSVLRKKALDLIPESREVGEEEFYNELITRKELLAYETRQRFYEIGTIPSLNEFAAFMSQQESEPSM